MENESQIRTVIRTVIGEFVRAGGIAKEQGSEWVLSTEVAGVASGTTFGTREGLVDRLTGAFLGRLLQEAQTPPAGVRRVG